MNIKPLLESLKNKPTQLNETLEMIKFYYKDYKHNKTPLVKVLDYKYPGRPGQKTYGQREDLLGWNVNYFENKEDAIRTIDDIDTFARMLSVNKQEKYRRIKYFFSEQANYLRRYKRDSIKSLKIKDDWFWRVASFEEAEKRNNEQY
jgi:hypothetical protein